MSDNIEYNSYNNIKRLSDTELENLWTEYLADRTNKKLRDLIIVQYIYLTKYVIGRIKLNLPPNFAIEDITSFGVEGLIDAIEKFSLDKGAHFETYAIMRIRGTIIDKIRSQDWLPRSMRKRIKDVKTTSEDLKQKLGRTPTTQEIADALGISCQSLSKKINNRVDFKSSEIQKAVDYLGLSDEERNRIFFGHNVDIKST